MGDFGDMGEKKGLGLHLESGRNGNKKRRREGHVFIKKSFI